MRHGSAHPRTLRARDDLGRFGLGLKTASFSQCRQLTVISRKNGDLEIVRRVESETPSGGRLLTFGLTLTFQHYSHLETLELFHLSGTDLTNLVMEHRPTFLLIDTVNVETQWAGRPPSENYDWLRAGPGLVTVDRLGSYTLFKVDDLLP